MQDDDDSPETTNRRSVLKNVAAGALATTAVGGAASAATTPAEVGTPSGPGCVREWGESRCVDAGCDCSDPCIDCECDTELQTRDCCEDSIGHILCGPWTDTGNCCSSC